MFWCPCTLNPELVNNYVSLLLKKVYKSVFKQMSATAYFDVFSQLTFYSHIRGSTTLKNLSKSMPKH